ncbi:MAG: GTPase [Candidatus Eisenbacteria bacterium]|uniref:GTPase n=1 Tax=Eiseniibacteriota bacterium TaxID=2212470 RepID=A0A937XCU8_UNCEI|nr:GTPase [Candidatus Eisenbacteria bacterium]
MESRRRRIVILGAGGRDFHNFNMVYRGDPSVEVVAITAAQIPGIDQRHYPPELSGKLYPQGIPIVAEERLPDLIREFDVDEVVLAYSDLSNDAVMAKAAWVASLGPHFTLLGTEATQAKSSKPVIAVQAVRTGCGKSQTSRRVTAILRDLGRRAVAIRHPMPYGDLARQGVQRFAAIEDLVRHKCTIEEMEEYEPHIENGTVCYAGVDYEAILREAEKEADVVVWDGGNNDTSFYKADLTITVVDPHRPGHELLYYPGQTCFLTADVVVINKVDTAEPAAIARVRDNTHLHNPGAVVVEAASPLTVERPEEIRGRRVLVVEDGPTLTHGGMQYGAGMVAARRFGAGEIVDPRPYLVGELQQTFAAYPGIGALLPAMGYGEQQVRDLEATIARVPCDVVVIGTPIDLRRIVDIKQPSLRVRYELQEIGRPDLAELIRGFLAAQ